MYRLMSVLLMAAGLCGCAALRPNVPPMLRLAPAALGYELSVAQRVTVSQDTPEGERSASADAVLEVDDASVRMAVLSMGQPMLRLAWDGQQLTQSRAPGWPDVVSGEQILSDVQLALWPASAIRATLPAGWTINDHAATSGNPAQRWLNHDDSPVVRIDYPSPQHTVMTHLPNGAQQAWRVDIESASALPFEAPQP